MIKRAFQEKNYISRTPPRRKSVFSNRFFVLLIGGVLAAFLAANGIWLVPSLRRAKEDVTALQRTTAQHARSSIEQLFAFDEMRVESFAHRVGSDITRARQEAEVFLRESADFQGVTFFDAEGTERFRIDRLGREDGDRQGWAREDGIRAGLLGERYISPVFFFSGEPSSVIVKPVYGLDGRVAGVVAAQLSLRPIWDLLAAILQESGLRVFITGRDGCLIGDPDPSIVLREEQLRGHPLVLLLREQARLSENSRMSVSAQYRDENNTQIFGVGISLPSFGWGVFVEQPAARAFAARNRAVALGGIFSAVVLLLVAVVGRATRSIMQFSGEVEKERGHVSAVLSNLTTGVVEYDRHFRVLMMNPAGERLLNISYRDASARPVAFSWLQDPDTRSVALLFFSDDEKERAEETPFLGPRTVDVKLERPIERYLRVTTVPITGEAGEITNYLKILTDITREKFIARLKTEFINIAAHQLRTPLSAVKWAMGSLLEGDFGKIETRGWETLRQGYDANENMIRLVNDLLDVSRIEEGRFGYAFAEHDIMEFLRGLIADTRLERERKQLQLHVSLPPAKIMLTFDKEKLRLAVANILENAIHYTPARGIITASVSVERDTVEIRVADTGVGIPEQDRKRLFTKFFRASNVVRMQTSGSGLGLFLAKNILINHGGDVTIVSKEGEGTAVSIILPRSRESIPKKEIVYEEFIEQL